MLHVVILAGGGGTRLWPLSRTHYPKQFLKLLGEHSLIQQTVLRVSELITADRLWIVGGTEQEFIIRTQLEALPGFDSRLSHMLSEPAPKNTAAAIGLAATHIVRTDPQAVMVILPADHWIEEQHRFHSLLASAAALAQQETLITLGVIPDRPETGYGYIQRGERVKLNGSPLLQEYEVYQAKHFIEKPPLSSAQSYVASGHYYWNAGIFIWRAATILTEIATYLPQLHHGLETLVLSSNQTDYEKTLADVYQQLDVISIDHGVLEKSTRLLVMPADIGWSDLGEWSTIHRLSQKDERGNTKNGNVINIESDNTFVYGHGRVVAMIGLKDTIVIDTNDALLVCAQNRTQAVKAVVQQLQTHGASIIHTARTVHRPWGTYTVLEEGENFKVKRLLVNPHSALSLQFHQHRSEHWVVISGIASVMNGDQQFSLEANQSTYIPAGTKHRLANLRQEILEIIEVSTGSYLGEDDIVRFDSY